MPARIPYLRAARPGDAPATPPKPVLRPMALLEVAQAEKFLCDLEEHSAALTIGNPATTAYLLGQAERHLARMSDILRAVTGLPR
jgi:hypothetical protein